MARWCKGFKVVDVQPGEVLESVSCTRSCGGVEYIPGKAVRPQPGCGPLCVFTSRLKAWEFQESARPLSALRIVECQYRPSRGRWVWRRTYGGHERLSLMAMPVGTALALEVILQE